MPVSGSTRPTRPCAEATVTLDVTEANVIADTSEGGEARATEGT